VLINRFTDCDGRNVTCELRISVEAAATRLIAIPGKRRLRFLRKAAGEQATEIEELRLAA